MADKQPTDNGMDYQRWKKRIEYNEAAAENAKDEQGWKRFSDYFYGDYRKHIKADVDITVINEVYSYLKTTVSGLYTRDPYIAVNALNKKSITPSKIAEEEINYYWRKRKIKRQVKKTIGEAKLCGYSFIKVGYDADISTDETAGETNEFVRREDIWAVHVPRKHILYDETCIDPLYDSRWLCHWYNKPTQYLRDKYNNPKIQPTSSLEKNKKNTRRMSEEDMQMTKVYEIWDKDSRAKMLMCEGLSDWLEPPIVAPPDKLDSIGPYQMDGFPFVMLRFNDIYDEDRDNYPMSDILPQEEQIKEKIKLRSMQLSHVKRHSRQIFILKGTIDKKELEKYEKGMDGAIIMTNENPSQIIWSPQYPQIQTDIYGLLNNIDMDRDKIAGQSGLDQGSTIATKTRTLGEINQISAGTSTRKNEQVDIVEDFCEEVSSKLIMLQKQYFDTKKTARIMGKMPQEIMQSLMDAGKSDGNNVVFTKEDIQGEYDIEVKFGSIIPLNKESRFDRIVQLLKFGQAIGLGPGTFSSVALGTVLFDEMEMEELKAAYAIDAQNMIKQLTQPQQPSPMEQLKMASMQTGMENTQVDTALKQQRVKKSTLDMVGKLIQNRNSMKELTKPPETKKEK